MGRALLACISRCACPACRSSARGDHGATGRGFDDGQDERTHILVGWPSVLGEHSVKRVIFILACAVAAFHGLGAQQAIDDTRAREAADVQLTATRHAPLPSDVSQYWFVQDGPGVAAGEGRARTVALARFAKGVQAVASQDFAAGFSLLNGLDLSTTPLAGYSRYYTGVALAGLSRFAEADTIFTSMMTSRPDGYLREAIPLRLAEVAVARQDPARAETILRGLIGEELAAPEEALLALALVE